MMCGTTAHGSLAKALANGGCGYTFYWDTGKPCSSFYIGMDGKRRNGVPKTQRIDEARARKAAAKRKKGKNKKKKAEMKKKKAETKKKKAK